MLRRDYIQRMIDEFAKVIASAMELNKNGRTDEALRTIHESYSAFFNEDAHIIRHLMPTQLIGKLLDDGFTTGQIEIFAEGIRAEADLLLNTQPGEAKDRYIKALALYEFVEHADSGNYSVVRRYAIEEIKFSISAL
jgi:hypothetical protein